MADNSVEQRVGGDRTWLWMVGAVVVVVAFMVWLGVSSEPTSVMVVEADTAGAGDAAGAAPLTLAEFAPAPEQYVGQTIRLADVQVASRLGEQAFWTQLPNDVPYLVRLDPQLLPAGTTLQSGQVYTIVGPVVQMSDSVLNAWQAAGVLADEAQRMEAEFASTFVEATRATPARAAGAQ